MSIPPPGGSIRMTSAPSAAKVAPPSGAATKAETSTMRMPARIPGDTSEGIVNGIGPLLLQSRPELVIDVLEDGCRSGLRNSFDVALSGVDLGVNLFHRRVFLGEGPEAFVQRKAPHALDR